MMNYPKGFFDIPCFVERTVVLTGNKWSLLIIRELNKCQGCIRYNELLQALKPISSKTLSARLKELVKYEILHKEIITGPPIRVEYSLTQKGKEFTIITKDMADWSRKWHNSKK
ncbi:MAG: helix-turn-helix domain-containing protein [Candidatus Woesearchaeota archaeon]